ncbi:CZB domain-containing protein [Alkalimarinus sediminis]|uniref:CZB domain-containing protein n=1 Tax=Alkalimarinus sediminis TaxID=1632866 RepID=A0A9E8KQR8_9ALTE|nr:CZB domain-containing protein [Alkalimarinus sediminis]UZW75470.1 CZB domain-containing protein [Alkalimarinus sediminis]
MSGQNIDSLFKDDQISVITFSTREATFAIPLEQVKYIEKDVKRNINVGKLDRFNHEVITYQNNAVPLFDFSILTGSRSQFEENKELIAMLNDREKDHRDWMDALDSAIKNSTPFTKTTDPNKCAFGVWYNQFTTNDSDLKEVLDKFDEPHKRIHALAESLLNQAKKDQTQALTALEKERSTTLAELLRLFETARERVRNSDRPIIVFVEQNDNEIGALRLDNIQDIESFSRKDFSRDTSTEGIMKKNKTDFVIEGFLRNGDSAPCMLINCQPAN